MLKPFLDVKTLESVLTAILSVSFDMYLQNSR